MPFVMVFFTSLMAVVFLIPQVIQLAWKKHLFDEPGESRKIHVKPIPNLGGLAIFTGFLFSALLYVPDSLLPELRMLLAAGIIIFMVGLKDDLIGLSARIKFTAQVTASGVVAIFTDLRIKEIYCFGWVVYPDYFTSIFLTVIFIVGLVNAYNLIDGIDGLAGCLGLLFSVVYGILFFQMSSVGWSILAFSLTGCLVGFLTFNLTPAKIFMGDSGSLLLGFIAAVFSLKFLNLCTTGSFDTICVPARSALPLVISIVIVPVFDTIRVFTLRILNGKSPFQADRNHLHHRLLSLGFTHMHACLILIGVNAVCIVIGMFLHWLCDAVLSCLLFLILLSFHGLLNVCYYKINIISNSHSM